MAKTWDQLAEATAAFAARTAAAADLSELTGDIAAIKQELADAAEALDPSEPEE